MVALQPPGVTASVIEGHWIHTEISPRWVRVVFNGETIADSKRVMLLRESGSLPVYYFPRTDVRTQRLVPSAFRAQDPFKGEATYWSLVVSDRREQRVAWSYPDPFPGFEEIRGCFAFYPARVECYVNSVRVQAQPGRFYGGWITPEIVGPFKGVLGSEAW